MKNTFEIIKNRISCRTFIERPVEAEKINQLLELLESNTKGPFGNKLRFQLVNFSKLDPQIIKSLGTYGFIKGATLFLAGISQGGPHSLEDFGFCMEKNILYLTSIGLSTCWLGASFQRKHFRQQLDVKENEFVPAISPVGYGACRRPLRESVIRFAVQSENRKPWSDLFFVGNHKTSLSPENAGDYQRSLEAVRLAPSASNRQPWRILKDKNKQVYNFYIKKISTKAKFSYAYPFQHIDIGIAMHHFQACAEEENLNGSWDERIAYPKVKEWDYIVSWTEL